MVEMVRARYTLEFKQEAVRLVRSGQPISAVARSLGISDQTLHNWLKAEAAGRLREVAGKAHITSLRREFRSNLVGGIVDARLRRVAFTPLSLLCGRVFIM